MPYKEIKSGKEAGLEETFWQAALEKGGFFAPDKTSMKRTGHPKSSARKSVNEGSIFKTDKAYQSDIPETKNLPKEMRDLLKEIEDLEKHEQMQIIHDFVNSNMEYPKAPYEDSVVTNEELIKNWRIGDCDKKAQLTACLLKKAGFNDKDITMLGGSADYGPEYEPGKHAVLVINIEGQHYMCDMNFQNAVPINNLPDGTFEAIGKSVKFDVENTLKIKPTLIMPLEKGGNSFMPDTPSETKTPEHSAAALTPSN